MAGKNGKNNSPQRSQRTRRNFNINGTKSRPRILKSEGDFSVILLILIFSVFSVPSVVSKKGETGNLPPLPVYTNFLFQPAVLPVEDVGAVGKGRRIEIHPLGAHVHAGAAAYRQIQVGRRISCLHRSHRLEGNNRRRGNPPTYKQAAGWRSDGLSLGIILGKDAGSGRKVHPV